MTIPAYPLHWPAGWERHRVGARATARFSKQSYRTSSYTPPGGSPSRYRVKAELSIAEGVDRVRSELARMGVPDDDLVITSNLELRLDGLPRSNQREPADPGIAVYWRDGAETRQSGGQHHGTPPSRDQIAHRSPLCKRRLPDRIARIARR